MGNSAKPKTLEKNQRTLFMSAFLNRDLRKDSYLSIWSSVNRDVISLEETSTELIAFYINHQIYHTKSSRN